MKKAMYPRHHVTADLIRSLTHEKSHVGSMIAGQARNDQVGHAHFQHRLKKYLTSMAVLSTMSLC